MPQILLMFILQPLVKGCSKALALQHSLHPYMGF